MSGKANAQGNNKIFDVKGQNINNKCRMGERRLTVFKAVKWSVRGTISVLDSNRDTYWTMVQSNV